MQHSIYSALRTKTRSASSIEREAITSYSGIKSLAATLDAANSWVADNIVPYRSDVNFTYITVGNEAIPGAMSQYIAQAIANMYAALAEAAITYIKVSTVIPGSSLSISYPPSAGTFTNEAAAAISSIASILLNHGASLMLNVYPYFAYAADTDSISLDYALLRPGAPSAAIKTLCMTISLMAWLMHFMQLWRRLTSLVLQLL